VTLILLIVFSALLLTAALGFAGWAIATAAAGREFESLGLPGDIVTALHAELYRRSDLIHTAATGGQAWART
jgi:hypothetical protein